MQWGNLKLIYSTTNPNWVYAKKKKTLIKAPNIGGMRSFPKEQNVAIFKNFASRLVRHYGQQSPIFKVELQKTCNVRITSWTMILIV